MPAGASTTEANLPIMAGNDPTVKELRDWSEAVRRIAAGMNWGWILNKKRSLFAIQQGEPHPLAAATPQTVTTSMTVQEKNSILKWNVEIELAARGERTKSAAIADFEMGQKNKLANLILASLATKARKARTWRDRLMAQCRITDTEHMYDGQQMLELIEKRLNDREALELFDTVDHDRAIQDALLRRLPDTCTSDEFNQLVNLIELEHKPYAKIVAFTAASWSEYIIKLLPHCCAMAGRHLTRELKGNNTFTDPHTVITRCCELIMEEARERGRVSDDASFQLHLAAQVNLAQAQTNNAQTQAQTLALAQQAMIATLQTQLAAAQAGAKPSNSPHARPAAGARGYGGPPTTEGTVL